MSFSLRFFKTLFIFIFVMSMTACGFHLRDSYNFPSDIQTLSVTSFDPYGNLIREMKNRLRQHQIELTTPASHTANLHLSSEHYGENTLSLYQNATVAQRQFFYTLSYTVTVPKKGNYNFSTSLSRSYLDNPLTALAKSVEEEMLTKEMRIEATKQIMRQLARLTAHIDDFDKAQAQEKALTEMYKNGSDENINIEIRFDGKETLDNPLSEPIKSKK